MPKSETYGVKYLDLSSLKNHGDTEDTEWYLTNVEVERIGGEILSKRLQISVLSVSPWLTFLPLPDFLQGSQICSVRRNP